MAAELKAALGADYVVFGGGNSKKLKKLPPKMRLGDNRHAFLGGFRLWQDSKPFAEGCNVEPPLAPVAFFGNPLRGEEDVSAITA